MKSVRFILIRQRFHFQVRSDTNTRSTTIFANFRIRTTGQPQTKTEMCFHQELEVRMFTLFQVLIIIFNSSSLETDMFGDIPQLLFLYIKFTT